jgi:hypothetical protein
MVSWNIGIYYGYLVNFTNGHLPSNLVAILYIYPRFGILNKEKSGNPGSNPDSVQGL